MYRTSMPHMKCLSTLILLNVVKTRTEITSMTSHRRSVTINFHYTEKHPLSKFRMKKSNLLGPSTCSFIGSATCVEGTVCSFYESLAGSITSVRWHIKPPLTTIASPCIKYIKRSCAHIYNIKTCCSEAQKEAPLSKVFFCYERCGREASGRSTSRSQQ